MPNPNEVRSRLAAVETAIPQLVSELKDTRQQVNAGFKELGAAINELNRPNYTLLKIVIGLCTSLVVAGYTVLQIQFNAAREREQLMEQNHKAQVVAMEQLQNERHQHLLTLNGRTDSSLGAAQNRIARVESVLELKAPK